MTADLRQLVDEAMDLTGAAAPALVEEDSPALVDSAVAVDGAAAEQSPYLIGLIGGKDVGKSALVNTLVGREITARTSHGPGTESVIAYAHESQAEFLRQLLEREVPGRFRIVTHAVAQLERQILLDLPDIDSHYSDHIQITRRMLRHMLYPIWIQSVEKYADRQPQVLLARVAAGNAPANFIFCLNKADQIANREGPAAAEELRQDYAQRLARTLGLPSPPRVWLISAIHPQEHELPALRAMLAQEKPTAIVKQSRQLASRQQGLSVLRWLDEQGLTGQAQRLARLQSDAEELLSDRLGVPLMERVVSPLLDDPTYRLMLTDECLTQRVRRWPLVGLVHVLLSPLVSVARRRLSLEQQEAMRGSEALVGVYLEAAAGDAPVGAAVQAAFAQLQQSHPQVSNLYRQRRLWEEPSATQAAAELQRALAGALDRQRELIATRVAAGRFAWLTWPLRWLLTVGAVLWFPFVQPILSAMMGSGDTPSLRGIGLLLVQVFSASYLLQNVGFLAIWFVILWLALRWNTQRRVARLLARWKRAGPQQDPQLSLAAQVVEWMDELLEPVREHRRRLDALVTRSEELRKRLGAAEAATAVHALP